MTLWKPFWANQAFPIRPLEDPKKAFGDPENLHVVANKEYAEDHPELANMLANFKLDDKQFGTLEDTVVNKFPQGPGGRGCPGLAEGQPRVRRRAGRRTSRSLRPVAGPAST